MRMSMFQRSDHDEMVFASVDICQYLIFASGLQKGRGIWTRESRFFLFQSIPINSQTMQSEPLKTVPPLRLHRVFVSQLRIDLAHGASVMQIWGLLACRLSFSRNCNTSVFRLTSSKAVRDNM